MKEKEDLTKQLDINFNKKYNELKSQANKMGALSRCKLCGKPLDGKVNSHSVPQMILKNIESDGTYCQTTCALHKGLVFGPFGRANRTGLNNTGTFHTICPECDKRYFGDYEQTEFWERVAKEKSVKALSDRVLTEIYLKSALREWYKKVFSRNYSCLLNKVYEERGIPNCFLTETDEMSILEDEKLIDRCKCIIDGFLNNQFEIIYFDVLDHSSNIASQALFPIQKTPTNEVVNDVFNLDPNYRVVLMEALVFPLKDKTVCLSFCLKEDVERLRPFITYMRGLQTNAKRKLFQSTLMAFTEEIYTNQKTIDSISKDHVTMSFIEGALSCAHAIQYDFEDALITEKPPLLCTKNFRKALLFI